MADTMLQHGHALPGAALASDRMPGHWLLARLGKRVLRPGGRELTDRLLAALAIGPGDDVVELAPGLGATTELVLARDPASYVGVDRDPAASARVARISAGPRRSVIQASAAETGLPDGCADVAFGEAYLTMQPASQKERILTELARIVRPGGRIGIHEIALRPDDLDPAVRGRITADLTGEIKVHVSPLTVAEWSALLDGAGFDVRVRERAPLHLLEPRRLVADEGWLGAIRFMGRVAVRRDARRRVLAMRSVMRRHGEHLEACAMVATRRSPS
ncbi:MAG: methyltransferase [Acidimicrobiia bacterium]